MLKVTDLYTPTDVKKVRELLLNNQDNKCAATNIPIKPDRTPVLDHAHDEHQYVRGVLEREVNAFGGTVENAHKRFLKYWLPTPLPDVLRLLAAYLEASDAKNKESPEYRHPDWIKYVKARFNTLKESDKDKVLMELCNKSGSNSKQRKELFKKVVLDRKLGYNLITTTIRKYGGNNENQSK